MSLKPIQHLIDNPNDVPDVPRTVKEYLQVVLNYSYLSKTGKLGQLKRLEGFSDEFVLGFLAGCEHASALLDIMEMRNRQED